MMRSPVQELSVVHLMGSLQPSGMERMLLSASPYFKQAGLKSTVICQGNDHPFGEQLRAAGYNIVEVPTIRRVKGALAYARLVRELRPDVLHIHTESAFAIAVLFARTVQPQLPIVRTIHNVFSPTGSARISREVQNRLADRQVSTFVAPSPDVARNERTFRRRAEVIYNWVDDAYTPQGRTPTTGKTAVLVGNCSHIKNHEVALHALLLNGYSVYHFGREEGIHAGERSMLDQLERSGRLLHRGVGNPLPALQEAAVFLMPSTREGMGVALAEAISCGIPAAVADVPGLSWARGIANVTHLPLTEQAWEEYLADTRNHEPAVGGLPAPNFSAERGVRQYVEAYQRVIRTSRPRDRALPKSAAGRP